jgi:phage tail sheath protein FI
MPTPAVVDETVDSLNQNLVASLPLLGDIERILTALNDTLPPSPAMAGIYTYIDATRGVWNAPANISLTSVVRPSFKVDDGQQADLNMPTNGMAINAIREFTGRGTLVWGARTLDGNSNDYRYIQVRRTLIYMEQSIKNALNAFVFAANDGNTWVTITALVSNFLSDLWSRGGLMGAKATDAFDVQCSLGSTMTPTDILQGYMIVQVRVQLLRPAEFIELTFKQKMQGIG